MARRQLGEPGGLQRRDDVLLGPVHLRREHRLELFAGVPRVDLMPKMPASTGDAVLRLGGQTDLRLAGGVRPASSGRRSGSAERVDVDAGGGEREVEILRDRLVERVAGLGARRARRGRETSWWLAAAHIEHGDVEGAAAHVEHEHPQRAGTRRARRSASQAIPAATGSSTRSARRDRQAGPVAPRRAAAGAAGRPTSPGSRAVGSACRR